MQTLRSNIYSFVPNGGRGVKQNAPGGKLSRFLKMGVVFRSIFAKNWVVTIHT